MAEEKSIELRRFLAVTTDESELLKEAFIQKCFDERNYFWQQGVVPLLHRKHIRILEKLSDLGEEFLEVEPAFEFHYSLKANDLRDLIGKKEAAIVALRSRLAMSLNPVYMKRVAEKMINLELDYAHLFVQHSEKEDLKSWEEDVKASEFLDSARYFFIPAFEAESLEMLRKEKKRIEKILSLEKA